MSVVQATQESRSWTETQSTPWISEDWLSVVIGLLIFVLGISPMSQVSGVTG